MVIHVHNQPRYSKRLMIRPFRRRDVAALHEAVSGSLDELRLWLPWADDYARGSAQRFVRESVAAWAEGRAFDFTIRAIDDSERHIGNLSVWPTSQQNLIGEIGYWIRTDETGHGFGTEATTMAMQIGFEEMGLHKLQLRIADENLASIRIAEKLGFVEEGTLRDEVRVGESWYDHSSWSMLENEWSGYRDKHRAEGTIS